MTIVGFIGLGTMGTPMAECIARHEFPLVVYNRSSEKTVPFRGRKNIQIARTIADLAAREPDIIFTSLTNDQALRDVLYGNDGLVQHLKPDTLLIDTSTVAPSTVREIWNDLSGRGIGFIDAPVTGGESGAREGNLLSLVGGDPMLLESARPIMMAYSAKIDHWGAIGRGQEMKMLSQILVAQNTLAVAETLRAAHQLGFDQHAVVATLMHGYGRSHILKMLGPKIAEGDFTSGFKIELLLKDLDIAAEVLAETRPDGRPGIRLRGLDLIRELIEYTNGISYTDYPATQALNEVCARPVQDPIKK